MNTYNSESVVIGTIIADPSILPEIEDVLSLEDFNHGECRQIFADILKREKDERPIDVFSISETTGIQLDRLISYQQNQAGYTKNALSHAKKIKTLQKRARLTQLVQSNINAIQDEENSTDEILERLTADLIKVTQTESDKQSTKHIYHFLKESSRELAERVEAGGRILGLTTGFEDLDRRIGGFRDGDLITIAGRPGSGKTTLVMNISEHVAIERGEHVLGFSLEMKGPELSEKMAASVGVADFGKIRSGKMDDLNWGLYTNAIPKIQGSKLHINDNFSMTIQKVRAEALRKKAEFGSIGLVWVDHIGKLKKRDDRLSTVEHISEVTAGLKELAGELGCPVIGLSQLNRKCEERPDKRPLMSDLKNSGSIEEDSNAILLCYRDAYYKNDPNNPSPWGGIAEINCAKLRAGETGVEYLEFQGKHQRFVTPHEDDLRRVLNIVANSNSNNSGGFQPKY